MIIVIIIKKKISRITESRHAPTVSSIRKKTVSMVSRIVNLLCFDNPMMNDIDS